MDDDPNGMTGHGGGKVLYEHRRRARRSACEEANMRIRILVVAGLALVASAVSPADEIVWTPPGALRFVVVDRDMRPVAGVPVTATAVATGGPAEAMTITDAKGRAGFSGLSPREYVIRFDLSGFAPASIGPVRVKSSPEENPRLPEFLVVLNPILWS